MDIFKDTFLGYSIYLKSYKRRWKQQGYYAKNSLGHVCDFDGQTYFNNKNELYAKLREKVSYTQNNVYTDPYNIALHWYQDENNKTHKDYKEIELLLGQYYCGLEAKKDLKRKLFEIGLIK